jgi:hypothetical protein
VRRSGDHELDTFWLRKSKQPMLAVLLVQVHLRCWNVCVRVLFVCEHQHSRVRARHAHNSTRMQLKQSHSIR